MKPTPTTKVCEFCGDSFTLPAYKMRNRRFCSQDCMGAASRKRVAVRCDACGVTFEKTDRRVGAYNYCSMTCSRSQHAAKLVKGTGPGRGTRWDWLRLAIIDERGDACEDCGISGAEHYAKHGHALHLHHITPYRISKSDDRDNLRLLCFDCHALIEPHVSSLKIVAGSLPVRRQFPRQYEPCPQCGGPKAKHGALCRSCKNANHRAESTRFVCPVCGGYKANTTASRCWDCRVAHRA